MLLLNVRYAVCVGILGFLFVSIGVVFFIITVLSSLFVGGMLSE